MAEVVGVVPPQPEGFLDHRGGLGAVHHPPVLALGMQHLGVEDELVPHPPGFVALDIVQHLVAPEQQLRATPHIHLVQAAQVGGPVDDVQGLVVARTHHLQPGQGVELATGPEQLPVQSIGLGHLAQRAHRQATQPRHVLQLQWGLCLGVRGNHPQALHQGPLEADGGHEVAVQRDVPLQLVEQVVDRGHVQSLDSTRDPGRSISRSDPAVGCGRSPCPQPLPACSWWCSRGSPAAPAPRRAS